MASIGFRVFTGKTRLSRVNVRASLATNELNSARTTVLNVIKHVIKFGLYVRV